MIIGNHFRSHAHYERPHQRQSVLVARQTNAPSVQIFGRYKDHPIRAFPFAPGLGEVDRDLGLLDPLGRGVARAAS